VKLNNPDFCFQRANELLTTLIVRPMTLAPLIFFFNPFVQLFINFGMFVCVCVRLCVSVLWLVSAVGDPALLICLGTIV